MNNLESKTPERILERIRSLLAMSRDTSSPNEAAIALRRARKLMDEHQVNMRDFSNINKSQAFGKSKFGEMGSRQYVWVSIIAIALAEMNDCITKFQKAGEHRDAGYVFLGFKDDVCVCKFMLNYLIDTCHRLYKRDKEALGLTGLGDKNDYLTGIAVALRNRINLITSQRRADLAVNAGSCAMIKDKTMRVEQQFGKASYSLAKTKASRNQKAMLGGHSAAKEVHLGGFVEATPDNDLLAG